MVTVEVPVSPPPEPPVEHGGRDDARRPPRRRVLVVDDEQEVAEILADLLAADGHEVETAPDGARALDVLAGQDFDLVLCDMRMPKLDGPGLYRELERRGSALCRRFVFLTGDVLTAATREFLESTGAPSLDKPFDVAEVLRVVDRGRDVDPGPPP